MHILNIWISLQVTLNFMHFTCHINVINFCNFNSRLVADYCSCKPAKKMGRQEFDIPKTVLDLIYGQALLWLVYWLLISSL